MANQNFKVKKGLEVGTALTATSDGLNVTGVITATQFSGDGSGLTGITAAGSGVVVQEEGSNIGTAATINFIGSNVTAALSGGIANVTVSTGGLSNVVEDTTPQLGGNLDLNSKDITGTGNISITGGFNATGVSTFQNSVTFQSHASFGDSDKINFGNDQDLQIIHNGTSSFITNTAGGLYIRNETSNSLLSLQADNGSGSLGDYVVCNSTDQSVNIKSAGSNRFAVNTTGCLFSSDVTFTGDNYNVTWDKSADSLKFVDNAKIVVGTGDDLQIYHDGSHSYINQSTAGNLYITHGSETMIGAFTDGKVELRYDNSTKFETTTTGVDVTGEVQCDSLDVDGNADITGTVSFGSTVTFGDDVKIQFGDGTDTQLFHTGTKTNIKTTSGQSFEIHTNAFKLKNQNDNESIIIANSDSSVDLYYDNSKKFETTTTGATVTGTLAATAVTGDGSGLTSLTGASAGTYGASTNTPIITVDSNGRITGIATVATSGAGGGGGISNIVEDTTPQLGGDLDLNGNDITGTGNITITSADAGSSAGPEFKLHRNSASPADADYLGQIKFAGESDTGVERNYAKITGKISDASNGTEDGIIEIAHIKDGSQNISARWTSTELKFLNGTDISMADGLKVLLGTNDDADIYHDGSDAYFRNGTGQLLVRGNDIKLQSYLGETYATFANNGAVSLYYDNALKLATKSDGVDITGELQCDSLDVDGGFNIDGSQITYDATSNIMKFTDDAKLYFGSGNDFRIYHDSNHSYIQDAATGNLLIQGSLVAIQSTSGETIAKFEADGASTLNFDGSGKLVTTNTGVTVTGTLAATAVTGDGSGLTGIAVTTTSGIQAAWSVTANGSSAYRFTGPGNDAADDNPDLYLVRGQRYRFTNNSGGSHPFQIRSVVGGSAYSAGVTNNGASSGNIDFNVQHDAPSRLFYQCTAHSGMVGNIYITGGGQWQNTSVAASGTPEIYTDYAVGIGTDNPGNDLEIASSGSGKGLLVTKNGVNSIFLGHNGSGNEGLLILRENGTNKIQLYAESGQPSFINSGNLGIGTANPGERLHLTTTSGNCKLRIDAASAASVDFYNSGTRFSDMFTDAGTGNFTITNRQNADIILRTNGTNERVYIKSSGEVSMGGFTPTAGAGILQIAGGLRVAGSASASDTTSPYIYRTSGSDHLNIATSGSERLRIDSSGHVRINTGDLRVGDDTDSNAGSQTISVGSVSSGSGGIGIFANPTNGNSWVQFGDGTSGSDQYRGYMNYQHGDDSLRFGTAASEKLRITSGGNVNIGGDLNQTDSKVTIIDVSRPIAEATLNLQSSTTSGAADTGPVLRFYGHSGSEGRYHASIKGAKENGTSGNTAGYLAFNTRPAGGAMAERLRIDSNGRIGTNGRAPSSYNNPDLLISGDNATLTIMGDGSTNNSSIAALKFRVAGATTGDYTKAGIFAKRMGGYNDLAMIFAMDTAADANGVNLGNEKMRLTSAGRLGLGTNDPNALLEVRDSENTTQGNAQIRISKGVGSGAAPASTSRANTYLHLGGTEWGSGANGQYLIGFGYTNDEVGTGIPAYIGFKETSTSGYTQGDLIFGIRNNTTGTNNPTERVRFRADGTVHVGPSNYSFGTPGVRLSQISDSHFCRSGGNVIAIRRNTNDGSLIDFYQDGNAEGAINVSGSDVSLAGATLSRWTQLPGNAERTEILRGTVLSNLDEMCEWGDEDNEQLNRMKVSDVEGDVNVAGVFRCWDDDDETYLNDYYCAMTGDFVIRIAQGVTVARGDLLMSAGDGTAKPQGDDIVRSKTVAKVTSTTVSATYSDGSYCVPCVLMAC